MGRAVFHTAFELSPVTVEPRKDLDAALLAGAVLEQFLFTGADGSGRGGTLRRRSARVPAAEPEIDRLSPRRRLTPSGGRSGDIDARDVKAQEAAEGCAEYEGPQEYRQYR